MINNFATMTNINMLPPPPPSNCLEYTNSKIYKYRSWITLQVWMKSFFKTLKTIISNRRLYIWNYYSNTNLWPISQLFSSIENNRYSLLLFFFFSLFSFLNIIKNAIVYAHWHALRIDFWMRRQNILMNYRFHI